MTDTYIPDRWLDDPRIQGLSNAAYRLLVLGLVWTVSNHTNGVIEDEDLPLIPSVDPGRAVELGEAGLWERRPGQWLILDREQPAQA